MWSVWKEKRVGCIRLIERKAEGENLGEVNVFVGHLNRAGISRYSSELQTIFREQPKVTLIFNESELGTSSKMESF
jgi:hypothetical protein